MSWNTANGGNALPRSCCSVGWSSRKSGKTIPFLVAQDEQLRQEVLGLPLVDADGRRLRYASPVEVENNAELGRRWAELQRRQEAEGKDFRLTGVEKSIKNLVDAYGKYRQLTFNLKSPKVASQRFYGRVRAAGSVLGKLAGDLQAAKRISRDKDIRQAMVQAGRCAAIADHPDSRQRSLRWRRSSRSRPHSAGRPINWRPG